MTLRQEAHAGQAESQFALGKYYAELDHAPDKGGDRNQVALKWFMKAAVQGHTKAQHQLGLIYAWGAESLRNEEAAELWLRKATKQGHVGAWIDLGWLLCRRNEDPAAVIRCFEQAIAHGSPAGYYNLGVLYEHALKDKRDRSKAQEFYRAAAKLDYAPAHRKLGQILSDIFIGHPPVDLTEAVLCFRRATELGDADGQYELGKLYEHGRGVPKDVVHAVDFYRLAAVQGHVMAQNVLGRLCREGRGVPQDFAGALQWFRKAATRDPQLNETEVTEALNAIGEMYLQGQGVVQDIPTAIKLFKKAASGNPAAYVNLGILYFEGKLVPCNYIGAKECFSEAARSGNIEAKGWLVRMKTIRLCTARPPLAATNKTDNSDQDQLKLGLL